MHIHAAFDSGNIEVIDASDPHDVRLRIAPDPPTLTPDGEVRFKQWFCFRVDGAKGVPLTLRLTDAHEAAYTDGWPGYRAVVSHDGKRWTRTHTTFEGGVLTISVTPDAGICWVAYFAPYPLTRVADAVATACQHPDAQWRALGHTCDGRTLDWLTWTSPRPEAPVLWILARQHPGESMASWWMEGFLARLCDDADRLASYLRAAATVHVVPHMNPDGSFRGHLRTNAEGINLNRAWDAPDPARAPEVFHTLTAMDATGVDLCLDVHGDEALPYTFVSGAEGIPGWTPRMARAQACFLDAYERANPAFQQVHGYPIDAPGSANMTMCTNAVAQRYDALAMTLEMPFKDDANAPDPHKGWDPHKCRLMGRAAVDALVAVLPELAHR